MWKVTELILYFIFPHVTGGPQKPNRLNVCVCQWSAGECVQINIIGYSEAAHSGFSQTQCQWQNIPESQTGPGGRGPVVVCSTFNYCWWKGYFVWRTSESGISGSHFRVLGCLAKLACNPPEIFFFLLLTAGVSLGKINSNTSAMFVTPVTKVSNQWDEGGFTSGTLGIFNHSKIN